MFVDQIAFAARAGAGGAGSAHLASEPFKPRAGADGGDGGKGGDVILRVVHSVFDLSEYADRPRLRAEDGKAGARANRTGAGGEDLVLAVPDGTVVSDERGPVADLVGPDASVVVARGGRGGRGNASLASARNRTPRTAEPGEPGEEHRLELELRLVADVGLVGLPNAGKSTLLSRLTEARPKIAAYPFTTLSPNLGVARDAAQDGKGRFVVADVPGLIRGAHEGKGLGLTFLRHVSRCRVLVYVVDLAGDPAADLATVRAEVRAFDRALAERRSLVVGTKADLVDDAGSGARAPIDVVVSALSGEGLEELGARLGEEVARARAAESSPALFVVLRPGRDAFTVSREGERFRVSGRRVERWVAEVDMEDQASVTVLQRRLARAGVERRLAQEGAGPGDEVIIGATAFEFTPDEQPSQGRKDEA